MADVHRRGLHARSPEDIGQAHAGPIGAAGTAVSPLIAARGRGEKNERPLPLHSRTIRHVTARKRVLSSPSVRSRLVVDPAADLEPPSVRPPLEFGDQLLLRTKNFHPGACRQRACARASRPPADARLRSRALVALARENPGVAVPSVRAGSGPRCGSWINPAGHVAHERYRRTDGGPECLSGRSPRRKPRRLGPVCGRTPARRRVPGRHCTTLRSERSIPPSRYHLGSAFLMRTP